MLSQFLPVATLFLSTLFHHAGAAPSPVLDIRSSLGKRSNTYVGCSDDQRTKLGTALADMANLGLHGFDQASTKNLGYESSSLHNGVEFESLMRRHTRFTHYFKNDELDTFKKAMSTISSNNDPTNPPYRFIVNCKPTGDVEKSCGKKG